MRIVLELRDKELVDFPVDMVYLWCDSSDKSWLDKKNNELDKCGIKFDNDAVSNCRFLNNDELKYSLRSLEKFAPWINNIYIVTDNQIPEWLDLSNPKINIINHTDILPAQALPTFNSVALETVIHKISNLSEHFLYANDDMFFGNFVDKTFFFNTEGMPIVRFSKRRIINKKYRHLYGATISEAYKMVKNKFGESCPYFPHHNIDAYRKSDIEKCQAEYPQVFLKTSMQKFRQKDGVQRSIYGYFVIAKSLGEFKIVDNYCAKFNSFLMNKGLDSVMFDLKKSKLDIIIKKHPYLFCLNDSLKTSSEDRLAMKEFLENKFPNQSSFEIKSDKNVEIDVCYHKEFPLIKNEILKPIQVGASLSEVDLGISKDNTDDNISEKNPYYCELTALYHMWKNSNADYVGLMHYRRLLDLSCGNIRWYNDFPQNIDEILSLNKSAVNTVMSDYDIILPMKRTIQQSSSVYNYYNKRHYISDLDRVLEIIQQKYPQIYDTAVDVCKNSKELYLYNIFISTREFLDEYAKWLFDILGILESEIQQEVEKRDVFQQRVYGFLAERMFTIYVEYMKKNGLKYKEVPTVYCETNKKRYDVFQTRTRIYKVLTKLGIRRPHWREQYGV